MTKKEKRQRRHIRIRTRIQGTKEIPRFSVFRSNKHIYAQFVDDENSKTIISSSDTELKLKKKTLMEKAELVGQDLAKKAKEKKIERVIFDRGGFEYTGIVRAIASSARDGGLLF